MGSDPASWVGVFLVGLGMLAGFVAWLFRANIKPLRIVIENNTQALTLVSQTLAEHTKQLQEHDGRIIEIETTHEILDCKHNRRISDKRGR